MTEKSRYEQIATVPLNILALIFIILYATEILVPGLPYGVATTFSVLNYLIWAVFLVDVGARCYLSPSWWRYLLKHPVDALAVLLPALRSLRVLRVFATGQLFLSRTKGLAQAGQAIVLAAGMLMFLGALAVLDAERTAEGSLITTFPDALWWAVTTLTTVGYGDIYPVTGTGRMVAAAMMFVGISLVGIITASIASWFVAQSSDVSSQESADTTTAFLTEITALRQQVETLQASIEAQQGDVTGKEIE